MRVAATVRIAATDGGEEDITVSERDHWLGLARWTPLAILADLDGTLIPFAATPDEARPGPELVALLAELAGSPGVTLAVVSGRPREALETFFPNGHLLLVAEHGGWRRDSGAWQPAVDVAPGEIEDLAAELRDLAARHPGAFVERKTWSVAFHFHGVPRIDRDAAMVAVENKVTNWLSTHSRFQELRGMDVLEIRPARMDKASAIEWLRERAGVRSRFVAFGDDITDEDMFGSLSSEDESVLVGSDAGRMTGARWNLDSPTAVNAFLRWMLAVRKGDVELPELPMPRPISKSSPGRGATRHRLLVVSNRLPELRSSVDSFDARKRNVGGLVSALEPALRARQGVWLGWSGSTVTRAEDIHVGRDDTTEPSLAWVDLPEDLRRLYYNGLCNRALWPLLHSFLEHVRLSEQAFDAYRRANEEFADAAVELVGPEDAVWVHDYHLMLLGARLRERGHRGPLGLFLHVPFPAPDIFFVLPWGEEILGAMLSFDLIGFHTPGYVQNFNHCASVLPGTRVGDDAIEYRGHRTHVGAFPIGIIPEKFQEPPASDTEQEVANLMRAIAPNRLVLGVDRLDYTKGIPERLTAFARLLETHPEWRRKVSLVQVSVPSRNDVPDYAEQRERVERVVGRTNGEYGDADWVPIRYLYRSFGRSQLSLLYRNAAVGYVTPMRDGMNLVAKEFVASQNPDDPGVLLLSRFAGAAVELPDAVLTNPWYVDGLARDLDRALRIGVEERRARHQKLLAAVSRTTALTWAEDFLSALSATRT